MTLNTALRRYSCGISLMSFVSSFLGCLGSFILLLPLSLLPESEPLSEPPLPLSLLPLLLHYYYRYPPPLELDGLECFLAYDPSQAARAKTLEVTISNPRTTTIATFNFYCLFRFHYIISPPVCNQRHSCRASISFFSVNHF